MSRTVILVPRRAGIPERDAIWAWCRARWEALHPDLPIYEGHHDEGPFNRSLAINLAARAAGDWDAAVIIDADVFLDPAQVRAAIARCLETGKVVWAFQWWCGTTREAAADLLAGLADPDVLAAQLTALHQAGSPNSMGVTPVPDETPAGLEKINPISWSCCFVVPRAAFDAVGGFDERFAGWGWEDMAFAAVAQGIIGHERIPGALVHLWHPRRPGLGQDGVNMKRNRQLGRRYMRALRAIGMHDRAQESDAEEMARDYRHLRDLAFKEEHDTRGRMVAGLPDWTDWWPSLEELVDGWRERRKPGPPPTVSVVVRTGGQPDAWPARSAYLERMLESLTARVRLNGQSLSESPAAVRLAIFSDWAPERSAELEAIATRFGFYVVGAADAGGPDFTRSMLRLWRYLGTRRDAFDYVLLVEDDFLFERDLELADLVEVLADRPHLVQMALLRDACYPAERAAGGILGHPDEEFDRQTDGPSSWMEHRRFFTLNPTLFRRALTSEPWPQAQHSEAVFGRRLFRVDGRRRAALWGDGDAWVTHLGEVRAGAGY